MLQRHDPLTMADIDKSGFTADFIDIDAVLATVRRQWRVVLAAVAIAGTIGLAYAATAVPIYSASATLLIDRNNSQVVEQLSTIGGVVEDEASILSQVEVLQSETIGIAVVESLNLTENQEFRANRASLLSSIFGTIRSLVNVSQWFSPAKEAVIDDGTLKRALSDRLLDGLSVKRIGRTYALELTYNSTSPVLAAKIVNAVASAYLVDKLNSKYEATKRASDWLSDRIAELRQRALDTDLAVQKFRAEHGLIETGNNGLLSDQQLAESNSALILAQSETARSRARVQRIEHILATDDVDAVVTDILESLGCKRSAQEISQILEDRNGNHPQAWQQPCSGGASAQRNAGIPPADVPGNQPYCAKLQERSGGFGSKREITCGERCQGHQRQQLGQPDPGSASRIAAGGGNLQEHVSDLPAALSGSDAAAILPRNGSTRDFEGSSAQHSEQTE